MRVFVTAKTNARSPRVVSIDDAHFSVAVKEPPQDGRANAAIVKALARHLGIAPSRVTLIRGAASKQKIFDVLL